MKPLQLFFISLAVSGLAACNRPAKAPDAPKPVLTVEVARPAQTVASVKTPAYGGVFAWQELSLGAEIGGVRVTELLVEVGDKVRRGQVLARLNPDVARTDVSIQAANLADAEATLAQAKANADRARTLLPEGAMSQQDYTAAITAEASAKAKREMLSAQLVSSRLKLRYTTLVAPDDGVISSRSGTVGQVVPAGTELFKLIRQNRLEWRAEVDGDKLAQFSESGRVEIALPGGKVVPAEIRKVAPSVDVTSRTGVVYVDVPRNAPLKPGMYVHGAFVADAVPALSVPLSAVVLRDGRQYVMVVTDKSAIALKPVVVGTKLGDDVVVDGVGKTDEVVTSGGAFLAQGDLVTVTRKATK